MCRAGDVAEELLAAGRAYHCYATAEELTSMRETARAEGRAPRYDGRWRDRDPSEARLRTVLCSSDSSRCLGPFLQLAISG